MFKFLRHPKRPVVEEPSRWPSPHSDLAQWMRDQIAYYEYKGYDPARFFSPCCNEYFPNLIQVGSSYTPERKLVYQRIKAEYPQLVTKARNEITTHLAYRVSHSRFGDYDDFKHLEI